MSNNGMQIECVKETRCICCAQPFGDKQRPQFLSEKAEYFCDALLCKVEGQMIGAELGKLTSLRVTATNICICSDTNPFTQNLL